MEVRSRWLSVLQMDVSVNARQELGLLFEYCALLNPLAIGGDMILQQDGSEYIYYVLSVYSP